MKKNKMMRLASVLLVAVLMTTCAISGTFAKYVTADDAKDEARVAKWGVTVTGSADAASETMFSKTYKDPTNTNVTVESTTDDLVAPGTKGEFSTFTITGTPEVDVTVSYTATVTLTGWTLADGTYYCPIAVSVNGTPVTAGTDANSYAENIKNAIEDYTKSYDSNTDLSSKSDDDLKITWEWAFSSEGNDVKDTYLGNQAASNNASKISISVTATVTQVD